MIPIRLVSLAACCAFPTVGGPLASPGECQTPTATAEGNAKKDAAATKEAAAKKPPIEVKFADDALVLPAPGHWRQVRPRNRIIEHEFSVAPAKSESQQEDAEPAAGRVTVMRSGGGVEANIARWIGQFRDVQPTAEGEKAKIDKQEVAGMPLVVVDISGTFLDSPRGPFGPKTPLPNHRMLGAILQTPGAGAYFFKFVGPQELVKENVKAFHKMLAGIKALRQ